MGVLDGQGVNAAVTNPAFINKNINDTMPNILGFDNPSTPSIADIQAAVNNIYDATGVNEIQPGTNYNATPGTITNGQNYQTALGILSGKFDPATGHFHTGAAGDGPILDVVLSLAITGGSPQTGAVSLVPGNSILMTVPNAGSIEIAVSGGVSSLNVPGSTAITGGAVLEAGSNITLVQTGQNIQINSTGGGATPPIFVSLSGSGTYFPTFGSVQYIVFEGAGAGGGGGGSSTALGNPGAGNGSDTTFGPITAGGGNGGGGSGTDGGAGGSASLGSGPTGSVVMGGHGGASIGAPATVSSMGGAGGNSGFGGGGPGGQFSTGDGIPGVDGTGGGGGGGLSPAGNSGSGAGGGAGGYVWATISGATLATIVSSGAAFSIGVGGTIGSAGTGGNTGSKGGDGVGWVVEYY